MNSTGQREPNRMKRDLAAGKVCLGATMTFSSPVVAEIMSRVGFDWLWFDTEHTALSLDNVSVMLQATNGSDISSVIRVPWNDKTMIKRALDTGPDGILVPLINSRAEAEAAVRAMKYPPVGERGAGLGRAQAYGMHMAEYLATANEEVMTIFQIEHIDAVNNIDEIVAVEGVDWVFVGALDLSGSMGMLGRTDDPQVEEAVQAVLSSCKRAGLPCGILALGPDQANRRIREGFTAIIAGVDVLYLHGAASAALREINKADAPAS
jgi:2-dehydro-3-deoxyglucarate aldolase/4-hydroxy-2-oxoheptanedioate aldolase